MLHDQNIAEHEMVASRTLQAPAIRDRDKAYGFVQVLFAFEMGCDRFRAWLIQFSSLKLTHLLQIILMLLPDPVTA